MYLSRVEIIQLSELRFSSHNLLYTIQYLGLGWDVNVELLLATAVFRALPSSLASEVFSGVALNASVKLAHIDNPAASLRTWTFREHCLPLE